MFQVRAISYVHTHTHTHTHTIDQRKAFPLGLQPKINKTNSKDKNPPGCRIGLLFKCHCGMIEGTLAYFKSSKLSKVTNYLRDGLIGGMSPKNHSLLPFRLVPLRYRTGVTWIDTTNKRTSETSSVSSVWIKRLEEPTFLQDTIAHLLFLKQNGTIEASLSRWEGNKKLDAIQIDC